MDLNKEKLSQNTITAIIQDKEGFMWLGSQDGLNRYDGYNFKIFKKNFQDSNSISENYIIELFEDSDRDLWVGTSDSGIVLYNKAHEKFIKSNEFDELSNEYITYGIEEYSADGVDGLFDWIEGTAGFSGGTGFDAKSYHTTGLTQNLMSSICN